MKNITTSIIFLFISTVCFSQSRVFQEVSITGNRVNIRTEPNLNCKVVYQRDWGDTFQGARYNDEWYELIDEDNNILYGYHKYVKFVEKTPATQEVLTSTTSTNHNQKAPPVTNVVRSEPFVLYQSEPYTLENKPAHIPAPTMNNRVATHQEKAKEEIEAKPAIELIAEKPTPAKVADDKIKRAVSTKVITEQKLVTTETAIQKSEKSAKGVPVDQPVIESEISNIEKTELKPTEELLVETTTKPQSIVEKKTTVAESSIKKVEEVAKTKVVAKPVAEKKTTVAESSIKKVEEAAKTKVVAKPVAEKKTAVAESSIKKVEETVKTKVVAKPVAEKKTTVAENSIKKVEEVAKTKVVAKPVAEKKTTVAENSIKKVEEAAKTKTTAQAEMQAKGASIENTIEEVQESNEDVASEAEVENESPEAKEIRLLIEQLELHIESKNRTEARKTALDLINDHVDESLETEDGICILVGEKAYTSYFSMLPDNGFRIRELRSLLNDVLDPLVINLIRLDVVDDWIQKEEYQYALDIMDNTMTHNSESLTLPKHCENDPNIKSSPQIELKNKYFLVYHLLDDDTKKEILANLEKLTKAKNPITKNIAKDIHEKLSGDFWEKN